MIVSLVRTVLAALALGAFAYACSPLEGDGRHLVPLSSAAEARLASMGSSPGAAMMLRIFKEEAELEVWKRTSAGTYELFNTYEICAWSGELGPKFAEGDRQAPEGFYTINPGLMNPNSNYHLAFNLGFPNKFDRAHGRTGSHLMVHGACSSAGCYAMEDEQITEIYALAREAFEGGQRNFEVQIFPFRMTPQNLARHQDSPHMEFWQNIKQGYDYFEVAQQPPVWDVCDGRYVFREPSAANAAASVAGACAPVQASQAIVSAFMEKQSADAAALNAEITRLAQAEQAATAAAQQRADAAAAEEQRRADAAAAAEARGDAIENAVGGFFNTIFSPFGGGSSQGTQAGQAPAGS